MKTQNQSFLCVTHFPAAEPAAPGAAEIEVVTISLQRPRDGDCLRGSPQPCRSKKCG